jgi:23S rRNA (cytosine1962-C5)-methyltransferase
LDLRAGRRWVKQHADGQRVLNLFAYTCGLGLAAAAGGAREVWNVDFAGAPLEIGAANAELNGFSPNHFKCIHEDVYPVLRQLSGLGVALRRNQRRRYLKVQQRQFDLILLDPPKWAKSPFGAVDTVRDYPSLFKPAVLATAPGGRIMATNHAPEVDLDDWLDIMQRCAEKAERMLTQVEVIEPDGDFPSFDDRPPLKVAVMRVEE